MANVKQIEWVTPTVMTGTGREVIEQLRRSPARRTVAVSLLDNEQGVAAEIVFQRVAAFLPRLMEQNQQDNLKKIVSALLPDVAPSEAAMAQARMLIDAKSTILKSGDFIPAGEVSKLAGYSRTNPSVQPNKWKRNRAIFAIEHKGDDFFPLYALDPDDNYRPRKAVCRNPWHLRGFQGRLGPGVLVRGIEQLPRRRASPGLAGSRTGTGTRRRQR